MNCLIGISALTTEQAMKICTSHRQPASRPVSESQPDSYPWTVSWYGSKWCWTLNRWLSFDVAPNGVGDGHRGIDSVEYITMGCEPF